MLALRLAWRNYKSGELKLLTTGVVLAVALVSTVALFGSRLDASLTEQSNGLLGADKIIRSSKPFDRSWEGQANKRKIQHTYSVQFGSMIFAGEEMHLGSVRAVSEGYPLRGKVEVSDTPFALELDQIEEARGIPKPGEVWVDSRLLPLLGITLGGRLSVGEADFNVSKVIIRQPDSRSTLSLVGGGLMMNRADVAKTQVIQPGSRVQYHWLLAGDAEQLRGFMDWLEPELSEHESIVDVQTSQRGVSGTLAKARQFLLLAAVMGVLLAGVAIAMASRQFALKHTDQVALLKSLGVLSKKIRSLYFIQLIAVAVCASVLGLFLGEIFQRLLAYSIYNTYLLVLAPPQVLPYVTSFLSGLLCLICFALPALWFLPRVPPIKILRDDFSNAGSDIFWQGFFALFAIVLLTLIFSQSVWLSFSVLVALCAVILALSLICYLFLRFVRKLVGSAGNIWRLALANLQRRVDQTWVLLTVFTVAIMLLTTLTIVRTSIISDWQKLVSEDAPNHFLINIAAFEVAPLTQLLEQNDLQHEQLYPMVRGRLVAINQQPITEAQRASEGVFNREANLTWTDSLAADNAITQGHWWDTWQGSAKLPGVSIEQDLALAAGIGLGDVLRFSIGGLTLDCEVASFRSLDWRSMNPNFFFIFEPGALASYAPTYMTSLYLPKDKKSFVNTLLQTYPTVLVIELDKIIAQIQAIVKQTSNGVLLVLLLILSGSALVLMGAVNATMDARKQEVGLLRALGISGNIMLGSVFLEFSLLGAMAGIVAIVGAEILLLGLQLFVFETVVQPHFFYWLAVPLVSAVIVGLLGTLVCKRITNTSPTVVLRDAT